MSSQGSTKPSRLRMLGVLVAFAVSVPVAAPDAARAEKFNVGGGIVHGVTVFDGDGLPPADEDCVPGLTFTVKGVAPGVVYNTVTTGFVGDLEIVGSGRSECGSATESGGTLELTITGTGPTGSEITCDPLAGGFLRNATAVRVELAGSCSVNNYGTAEIQFLAQLQFTPSEPVGAAVTEPVKKAFFDGDFVIVPAAS